MRAGCGRDDAAPFVGGGFVSDALCICRHEAHPGPCGAAGCECGTPLQFGDVALEPPEDRCDGCGSQGCECVRDIADEFIEAANPIETWDFQWKHLVEVDPRTLTLGALRRRARLLDLADHIRGPGIEALREILARPCEQRHGYGAYTPCHARGPKGPVRRRENWCPTCVAWTAFKSDVRARFLSEVEHAREVVSAAKRFVDATEVCEAADAEKGMDPWERADAAYEHLRSLVSNVPSEHPGALALAVVDAAKAWRKTEAEGGDTIDAELRLRRAVMGLMAAEDRQRGHGT